MANSDVRPSDTLANERTFLAYIRTALAFVAFGFVIARFALFSREISVVAHIHVPYAGSSKVFGIAMAVVGALLAVLGGLRYTATDRAMRAGGSRALPPAVAYLGAAVIAVVGALVAADLFRF